MAPRSGSRYASRSPSRSLSSSACDPSSEYKWSSFEIRTLICLIIQGAHCDKNGPVDPMDFADKLNKALNPVKASTQEAKAILDRDIPVGDVQTMLRRILAKKSHAVDVVSRDPAAAITRRQVNVFMRQLDFDGEVSEWLGDNGREKVIAERAEMRRRLDKRQDGRPLSQERWEENQERLRDIQSPRAQSLLSDWSMGRTFFQDREKTMDPPTRGRSPTRRGRSASPGEIINDHANPFVSHGIGSNKRTSAWDNSLIAQTPNWGTTGNSPRPVAATPNPPAGGWAGGFVHPAPIPQMNGGFSGGGYGYAATPSMRDLPATTPAYGGSDAVAAGAGSPSQLGPIKTSPYNRAYGGRGFETPQLVQEKRAVPAYGYGLTDGSDEIDAGGREPPQEMNGNALDDYKRESGA